MAISCELAKSGPGVHTGAFPGWRPSRRAVAILRHDVQSGVNGDRAPGDPPGVRGRQVGRSSADIEDVHQLADGSPLASLVEEQIKVLQPPAALVLIGPGERA
jgi:hypothetical protein